jgi:Bacterial toxin 37
VPAYGAVIVPCIAGGELACYGAAAASSVPGMVGCGTVGATYPNYTDPAQPPGPGWEWRGKGPAGSSEGSWYNPTTDQSVHPDLDHPPGVDPHDYTGPEQPKARLFPGDPIPPIGEP